MTRNELKAEWSEMWGRKVPERMGQKMLEESLKLKRWERETGGIKQEHKKRLDELVKAYKRNSKCFDKSGAQTLTIGTQLVRTYKGQKHIVTVLEKGFDYNGQTYSSLSKLAFEITGTKWNGRLFFELKSSDKVI